MSNEQRLEAGCNQQNRTVNIELHLIEVLQYSVIIGSTAEGSCFELNAVHVLLLRFLQLDATMETVGCLCQGATEACGTL